MNFKFRYTPYAVIAVFCVIVGIARAAILTDLAWYYHVLLFLLQFTVFIGLWKLLQFLNRYLDTRISFSEKPVTRVGMQMLLAFGFLIPLYLLLVYVIRPYLPDFVTKPYIILVSILFFVAILMLNFGFYTNHFF